MTNASPVATAEAALIARDKAREDVIGAVLNFVAVNWNNDSETNEQEATRLDEASDALDEVLANFVVADAAADAAIDRYAAKAVEPYAPKAT